MMTPVEFTIVVPVFNASQWLERCIHSILRQGLEAYEIILVNDGSTDDSEEICRCFAERYDQVKVLTQQNKGVCAARNLGIANARGQWIIFLDADDYLLDDGLRQVFMPFNNRQDIEVIQYFSTYDYLAKQPITQDILFDGKGHEYLKRNGIISFCWFFAYRRDFLEKHQILFDVRYIVGEDQHFVANVLLHNPQIVVTSANIYRYVVTEGSATTKRDVRHTRRCVKDYLYSFHEILQMSENLTTDGEEDVRQACKKSMNAKKMFGFSRMLSAKYNRHEFSVLSKEVRALDFYPVIPLGADIRSKILAAVMNGVMCHYIFYFLTALTFNQVVVPFILPRIRHTV